MYLGHILTQLFPSNYLFLVLPTPFTPKFISSLINSINPNSIAHMSMSVESPNGKGNQPIATPASKMNLHSPAAIIECRESMAVQY